MNLETQIQLSLAPVLAWLAGTKTARTANAEYWRVRQQLLDDGFDFTGPEADFLSNIDTAMDAFNADPNRNPYQIDEIELRSEVEVALAHLRELGFPV